MNLRLVAAAVAACATVPFASSPAYASPTAAGYTCGATFVTDGGLGVLQPDEWFGHVSGGPYVVADVNDVTGNPVSGTVICRLRVNGVLLPASVSSTGVAGLGNPAVVYLPPSPLSFLATGATIAVCTEWDFGSTRVSYDTASGKFVTSGATCAPIVQTVPGVWEARAQFATA